MMRRHGWIGIAYDTGTHRRGVYSQLQIPAVEAADALLNLERSEASVSPAVLDRARKLLERLDEIIAGIAEPLL